MQYRFQNTVATMYRTAVAWNTAVKEPVFSTMKPTEAVPTMPASEPKVLHKPNI